MKILSLFFALLLLLAVLGSEDKNKSEEELEQEPENHEDDDTSGQMVELGIGVPNQTYQKSFVVNLDRGQQLVLKPTGASMYKKSMKSKKMKKMLI